MSTEKIRQKAYSIREKIIAIRRELHKNPELGFEEFKTSSIITDYLRNLGLEVKTGLAGTGVTALLRGREDGPTLAVRADIDALPVTELNNFEFKSVNIGKMHACGHDAHMSVVLGAADVLSSLKDEFSGNVKFIFQPGEEGLGGARQMIEEGALLDPKVDAIIAAHVDPYLNSGWISVRPGPVMATPSEFTIVISGKGGHAAQPQKAINPIYAASAVVDALCKVTEDQTDVLKKAVLTVTYIKAGSSYNIIPDTAVIKGTVRTFDIELSRKISGKIEAITASITEAAGAGYTLEYDIGYPPVFNHSGTVEALIRSAEKVISPGNIVKDAEPSMLAEDFAYYAQLVPGAYFHLGCRDPQDDGPIFNLHSSRFRIDEACIQAGIEIMSQFALDFLSQKT